MARVARAESDLGALEALAILALQRGILEDVAHVEGVFEALASVQCGLDVSRKWLRAVRSSHSEKE